MDGPDLVPAVVLATSHLTPRMVRVALGGPALQGYVASGDPDECCRVVLPLHRGDHVGSPPTTVQRRGARIYTVRRFDRDACELDVDVALHDGGPGAAWARTAQPGDTVALTAAVGAYRAPPGTRRLVLVGDATALPAIARIVEEAADDVAVEVVGVVVDELEQLDLGGGPRVTTTWRHVPHHAAWGDALGAAVRGLGDLGGATYTWVAGEAAGARLARRHLRHDRGLDGSSFLCLGYWRHGRAAWEARHRAVAPALERDIALTPLTGDLDAYGDAVDAIYDRYGL